MKLPELSPQLLSLDGYATKAMAEKARGVPGVINLAFGEPAFGPPISSKQAIEETDLNWGAFLDASKRYESNRGMPELRAAIADYYARRYDLRVDPETEILITHGGVEAISLAALVTTDPGEQVLITDPSYMLYSRALQTLGRQPGCVSRRITEHEYESAPEWAIEGPAKALIVNSPENPSGYVLSDADFAGLAGFVEKNDLWLIHDEVYDSMAFARPHKPARTIPALKDRSILINSFSKKYGVPGLRIGWMCAPAPVIDLAAKLHDYMYLGVNILSERIALRLISDTVADKWMDDTSDLLGHRAARLIDTLTADKGFTWKRNPHGSMFAFPDVTALAARLGGAQPEGPGRAVADWLLDTHKIATIPGFVYGPTSASSLRMILCCDDETFDRGLAALSAI